MTLDEVQDLEIRLLLEAVYQRYGYDFRDYARPTLRRRVLNMVQEQHLSSVSALQERVLRDPAALDRLTWHIAVNATSMFRDPGKDEMIVVTFEQDYQSNNLNNQMKKRQYWIREDGAWKIIFEGSA